MLVLLLACTVPTVRLRPADPVALLRLSVEAKQLVAAVRPRPALQPRRLRRAGDKTSQPKTSAGQSAALAASPTVLRQALPAIAAVQLASELLLAVVPIGVVAARLPAAPLETKVLDTSTRLKLPLRHMARRPQTIAVTTKAFVDIIKASVAYKTPPAG